MKFRKLFAKALIVTLGFNHFGAVAADREGGVSFGMSTRVIFNEEENKISFPISNRSNRHYIFQALVLNEDLKSYCKDFIVSPEVMHIPSGERRMAQIIRLSGIFPKDRETLFYLQGHFLPSSDIKTEKNNSVDVNMSYAIQMKMFFRPSELKSGFDAIDKVSDKLEFMTVEDRLIVSNTSPYYITVNTIEMGKHSIVIPDDKSMIQPFGTVDYELPERYDRKITWTLINDGGYATKPLTRNL